MLPQPSDSFLMLIDLADESLYEAKKMGKNRVVTHEEIHHFLLPAMEVRLQRLEPSAKHFASPAVDSRFP